MTATDLALPSETTIWSSLDPNAKAVYTELAFLAENRGSSRLVVLDKDLCQATHLSIDKVADAVAALADRGFVEVFNAPGRHSDCNLYVVVEGVAE